MAEEYLKGIRELDEDQLAFIEDEFGVTKNELPELSDEEIDETIYDPLCEIEVEESIIAGDGELSERGKMVSEIVTILGVSFAEYEGLLEEDQ